MRIIAERSAFAHWSAWWADEPQYCTHSTSRFSAVAKLLKRSNLHAVAIENLSIDLVACRGGHVEMIVKDQDEAE